MDFWAPSSPPAGVSVSLSEWFCINIYPQGRSFDYRSVSCKWKIPLEQLQRPERCLDWVLQSSLGLKCPVWVSCAAKGGIVLLFSHLLWKIRPKGKGWRCRSASSMCVKIWKYENIITSSFHYLCSVVFILFLRLASFLLQVLCFVFSIKTKTQTGLLSPSCGRQISVL